MRNKLIITAIAASLISGPALASEGQSSKEELIGITSGATIGAIAGGPIGLIVGAAIGAKAAEKYEHKNDKIDSLNASLDSSQQTIAGLEQNIDALEGDIDEMGGELQRLQSIAQPELLALMQAGIEMDLLFRTDEHTLADTTGSRLQTLATTLAGMPDVYVQLDGFADERGDEVYNQQLSDKRVQFVRDLLIANGIDESRIKTAAHGESPAAEANVDSYALERKVSLTLYVDNTPAFAAQ